VVQLGNVDLTSAAGKLLVTMLAAVASMERDLLIERTQSGLARAKSEGKRLGRPSKTSNEQKVKIRDQLAQGVAVSQIARSFNVSRANIISIRSTDTVAI